MYEEIKTKTDKEGLNFMAIISTLPLLKESKGRIGPSVLHMLKWDCIQVFRHHTREQAEAWHSC